MTRRLIPDPITKGEHVYLGCAFAVLARIGAYTGPVMLLAFMRRLVQRRMKFELPEVV